MDLFQALVYTRTSVGGVDADGAVAAVLVSGALPLVARVTLRRRLKQQGANKWSWNKEKKLLSHFWMLVFFDVILRVLSLSKEEGMDANVYCKSIYSIIDKGKDRMHTILFTFFT